MSAPIDNLSRSPVPNRVLATDAGADMLLLTCLYLVGADTDEEVHMSR